MKNMLWVLAATVLMIGCGSRQPANKTDVSTTPAQKGYVKQGIQYLKSDNPRDAIKSFDAAIRQNPKDPGPYLVLGETYLRLKRYDRAIDTFTAATRVAPTDGHLYYLLAVSLGLSGNMTDARLNAEKSFALFQRDKDTEGLKKTAALLKGIAAK